MEQSAPEDAPVLARWKDDTGVGIDVRLRWHASLPCCLPSLSEDTICTVQLCVPAAAGKSLGMQPQFLEARMKRMHLLGSNESWTPERLRRLMDTMANPIDVDVSSGESIHDVVQLRRGMEHMVIDVFFSDSESSGSVSCAGLRYVGRKKVVEILNAHLCATSACASATEFLRSMAMAQSEHRGKIAKAQKDLEASRAKVATLQARWEKSRAAHAQARYDRLRRFAVLLHAKKIKEDSLKSELAAQIAGEQKHVVGSENVVEEPVDVGHKEGVVGVHSTRSGHDGCSRGARKAGTARGRGRGRKANRDQENDVEQHVGSGPSKRAKVTLHADTHMNSILEAAAPPPPSNVGRLPVESILEPCLEAAPDEFNRRRAMMTQAMLEPDAFGDDIRTSIAKVADAIADPDEGNRDILPSSSFHRHIPLAVEPPSQPSSLPRAVSLAVPAHAATVASLRLFDPASSDDEPQPQRPADSLAIPDRMQANAAQSWPIDVAVPAPATGTTMQGQATSSGASQLLVGTRPRHTEISHGLFFSSDEEDK